MKIKYSKYTGEDFGINAEDLLQALIDFLLQSGFNTPVQQLTGQAYINPTWPRQN